MKQTNRPLMSREALKQHIVFLFKPFDPQRIIIFGSLARGDWDEMSDIDVIVVYRTNKSFLDRLKELYLSWDIPKAVDILAYTPEEFDHLSQQNFFIQEALNAGEVLYERN